MGNKGKISVTTQLEDSKALADAEAMRKSDAMKALSKAQAEIQLWKSRYETEGMGRIEELEGARAKLQAKIVENEELVDVLQTKVANAEKSKGRLGSDLDDISMEYERVHAAALITEKRAKNFDKVLGEWLKWRERSVSLRLSLHLLSLALGKQPRLSRGLSARAKSSP